MFLKGNQLVEEKKTRAFFVFCTRGAAEKQQSTFCLLVCQFGRVSSNGDNKHFELISTNVHD